MLLCALSLHSDIESGKKVDLLQRQKVVLWKSSFAEVEFILANLLIQKENDVFSLPSFRIEVKNGISGYCAERTGVYGRYLALDPVRMQRIITFVLASERASDSKPKV